MLLLCYVGLFTEETIEVRKNEKHLKSQPQKSAFIMLIELSPYCCCDTNLLQCYCNIIMAIGLFSLYLLKKILRENQNPKSTKKHVTTSGTTIYYTKS